MRQGVAGLLALTGFMAAALLGWTRGNVPMATVLGRALVALVAFGALGYGLGIVGERLAREVSEKASEKKPEAPPAAAAPVPQPGEGNAATAAPSPPAAPAANRPVGGARPAS